MPDREMVRKALECIAEDRQKSCRGCEYSIFGLYPFCVHGIARDALALLKEQEAVEPRNTYSTTPSGKVIPHIFCGKCNKEIYAIYAFCPFCGRAVKWE